MDEKTKRVGLFGGSFNPIHIGHLALANYLCEFMGLDEVWFLVSPQNPFKIQEHLLDDEQRLELAHAAIGDYPRFRVSDFEFRLPRPSYMSHTLDRLKEAYPDHLFHLIIGSDNWTLFDQWHEYERIVRENPVWIYPRPGFPTDSTTLPANACLVEAPLLDISSTFIRESLHAGKDVRFFLPPAVYRLILENKLYQ